MHMADALLSPAVGGTMCAVSAGTIAYCSKKVRNELDDKKVPLMGVLGAFLFAAQMINFTIPATGSSGHLGGGLLLNILLGPYAAFLTTASVLIVQALFFADGGLLAMGCNIFNMGFIPAFVVYPLIYKKIVRRNPGQASLTTATIISAIIALQLGTLSAVVETVLSGISSLPFTTFLLLMQPIHFAIGAVEGFVTVAIVSFVFKARPEMLLGALEAHPIGNRPVRTVVVSFLIAALLTAGIVSWFASRNPDGLDWAIAQATGKEELEGSKQGLHGIMAALQEKTAFSPDYAFKKKSELKKEEAPPSGELKKIGAKPEGEKNKPVDSKLDTSAAGLIGTAMVLALTFLGGFALKKRKQSA